MSDASDDSPGSRRSLLSVRAVAFWLCLLTASSLYAAVVLGPKWLTKSALRRQFETNQRQLLELNESVERLRRLTTTFERDPAFVREQARSEFDLLGPDEQRIRLDPPLTLDVGPVKVPARSRRSVATDLTDRLQGIAASQRLCDSLLAVAAGLVVFAFGCLYEPGGAETESGKRKAESRVGRSRRHVA